ncbi:ABC-three component system protein [Streptomyces sp. NPDC088146]|uniref:ABC-three component system protein n=1 Tax=Streptomyces sp. NPDC088146 TaxID=3365829 RepID=UPI00381E5A29
MGKPVHSAAASALGYQHQTWWALLELLRANHLRPDAAICLELHDDIAWEQAGSATELLQVKHHRGSDRQLTDASADVWLTLKNWMDTAMPCDTDGPALVLVSTQQAKPGSAMAALRPQTRSEQVALSALERAALHEASGRIQDAREQFLALGQADRAAFVSRIKVMDSSPHIEDIPALVRTELRWNLPPGHEDLFLAMVWRWWDEQALALLQKRRRAVDIGMARAAIAGLRDQFTRALLPTVAAREETGDDALITDYADSPFVHQMKWVGYPPVNLRHSVIDYHRAQAQAIRWIAEELVAADELTALSRDLVDEWETEFEWMQIELAATTDEATRQRAGARLLRDLSQRNGPCLQNRYHEAFFVRGQRHELADTGRVGWHPEFRDRMRTLQARS